MSRALVLIVDDAAEIRDLVRAIVERAGLDVAEAADGAEGLRQFYACRPALVVLDVEMPKADGWEVLERIRELSDVPILMLTATAGELDKVRGLRHGADDYVTKPFGRQELLARIEALLRRAPGRGDDHEIYNDELLRIDFGQRQVTVDGQELALTPTEFRLLAAFARHPNQVLSHDQLLEMVWGSGSEGSRAQVKLYVGYLRRKLQEAGSGAPLETVRGFGYRYRPSAPGAGG